METLLIKSIKCCKNNSKKEVYSDKYLHKETRNISDKQKQHHFVLLGSRG